jgi:hypothetical protein
MENIADFACRKLPSKHSGNLGEISPDVAWRDYAILNHTGQFHTAQ